ncbi:MAG: hypothetical protein EBS53_18330 [Bacteroidetes bacterium]|nr:hypothetical protein [Bacteroidota bacterium]
MKKINLLIGTFLTTVALSHAVDSFSDVVGYQKTVFPAGSSLQGVGFINPDVIAATATKLSASSISVPGLSSAANSLAPSGGLPTHYVEITSGSREGMLADILSNNGTTVVLDADISSFNSTETIAIRKHVKISDVFKNSTGLGDYQDSLSVYQLDGSASVFLRDSSTTTGWLDASSFNESDAVLYPSQGCVLVSATGGSFTFSGTVKKTKTVIPLNAGAVNIVSLGNPSSGNFNIGNINLGAGLVDYSDSVSVFSTNGALTQDYTLLWAGAADGFLDASTFSPVSGITVPGTAGFVVSVMTDTSWSVAAPYTP